MEEQSIRTLLRSLTDGSATVEEVLDKLRFLPFEDLGFAKVDHHRQLRRGLPEVIFGQGKTPRQIAAIFESLRRHGGPVMVTRVSEGAFRTLRRAHRGIAYHADARMVVWTPPGWRSERRSGIVVLAAGTSDIPIAEEAAITAEMMGNAVERVFDVGVAGIHRLLAYRKVLTSARVLIVVAGMEGALPGVVAGLVEAPIIAVPTSIGYGASFQGVAALLGMLNSCAGGLTVVNIDNGFGAGVSASLINRLGRSSAPGSMSQGRIRKTRPGPGSAVRRSKG